MQAYFSRVRLAAVFLSLLVVGCNPPSFNGQGQPSDSGRARSGVLDCDEDNGGLTLPDGFCALVVADNIGRARHLTVRDNGDIYVALRTQASGGSIAALRDRDGDGRADVIEYFGEAVGTGIHIRNDYLYFAANTFIERYRLDETRLVPKEGPETIVKDFPDQKGHTTKPFEFDDRGNMYVNVGAPSNACQDPTRTPGVPGLDPCPLLDRHGGVWRFGADAPGQTFEGDGYRYATGIRNGVANAWNPYAHKLFVAQHGRDQLGELWPSLYSDSASAELPAEELFEVEEGDDFGWPYCYYDHLLGRKVLGPEYGGDGEVVGRCAEAKNPVMAFPGHWAPNDLIFYGGEQFPDRYVEGAFIAFHGAWNRAPLEQEGYKIVFVPFQNGLPAGDYETFADGFAGEGPIVSSSDAVHRPVGLAVGPDGSLYISDSVVGRIWRVLYR